MHLAIFGSTGPTGRALVARALDEGHDVTAAARDPDALDAHDARVRVVRADVLDRPSVEDALDGVAIDQRLPRARKISRADLAEAMLRAIPERSTVRAAVTLAY
jgi:nucleoside-diphosphate-sugar epimerase